MTTISPQGRTELVRPDGSSVRVLVVDDEQSITELLSMALRYEGWQIRSAGDGQGALRAAREFRPDAVVLDLMLPDMDGLTVLGRLRRELPDVPVLFLTAKDAVEDRIAGLTAGGDDYVTKPFGLEEVVARLRGLIRRSCATDRRSDALLVVGDLTLDEDSHEVTRGGRSIHLTATEFELLRFLMRNPRRVLSKAQILDRVWSYDFGGQANVVELYISYLRRKIDAGREPMIHTRRGAGYLLKPAVSWGTGAAASAHPADAARRRVRHPDRGGVRGDRHGDRPGPALAPVRAARRAAARGGDAGDRRPGPRRATPGPHADALDFVTRGPQMFGTVGATVVDGAVTDGVVSNSREVNGVRTPEAGRLTTAQLAALEDVPRDRQEHTADLPGLGSYRVVYEEGPNGAFYVAVPTADVDATVTTLILVEISVTAAGLVAASPAPSSSASPPARCAGSQQPPPASPNSPPPWRGDAEGARTGVRMRSAHRGRPGRRRPQPHARPRPRGPARPPAQRDPGTAVRRGRQPRAAHPARLHPRLRRTHPARPGGGRPGHPARAAPYRVRGRPDDPAGGGPAAARPPGRGPLRFEETDLVPLVVDAVSDARAAGPDHHWRLDLPDAPAPVTADAARLQQVLVNLLANARTHTPPGTTVTARVRREGPWLRVDVADDGPGIPHELLPHVFERFARGDSARTRATGSTGLGLAIVQAVAAAHGGSVTVDSVPGRTVFTLRLPAAAPASPGVPDAPHSQSWHSLSTEV